jgi:hypothetical protein
MLISERTNYLPARSYEPAPEAEFPLCAQGLRPMAP